MRQTVAEPSKPSPGHELLVPVQLSAASQMPLAARQTVEVGANASAGHDALPPVQRSAESQTAPDDARQTTVELTKPLPGQVAEVPVQLSAASQTSAAERHTVLEDANVSFGQVAVDPVQVSCTSQTEPDDARQTADELTKELAGHELLVPVQLSATSQTPTALRHGVKINANWSTGQLVNTPVQASCTSHALTALRQTVPPLPAGCAHEPKPLHWSSVHGLLSDEQEVPEPVKQLSLASLQVLLHSPPVAHGLPLPMQVPVELH